MSDQQKPRQYSLKFLFLSMTGLALALGLIRAFGVAVLVLASSALLMFAGGYIIRYALHTARRGDQMVMGIMVGLAFILWSLFQLFVALIL